MTPEDDRHTRLIDIVYWLAIAGLVAISGLSLYMLL